MFGYGLCEVNVIDLWEDEEGVDEGGEVEYDGVKDNDCYVLEGVGIDDVGVDGSVVYLDIGIDCLMLVIC